MRGALNKLKDTKELMKESAKMQRDPKFQDAESSLKRECNVTRGIKKMVHEPPPPTELDNGTKARRQRLRRRLRKYYSYIAYCAAIARSYAVGKIQVPRGMSNTAYDLDI